MARTFSRASITLPLPILILGPLLAFAAGPPLLPYLTSRLASLQSQLTALNQHIADEQHKQQTTLTQTAQLTRRMLSLSRWPLPLTTLSAVSEGHINTPQLLSHMRSQTMQALAAREKQLQTLTSLREQAQTKATAITTLKQHLADGGKTLTPDDKAALYATAASADQLAISIQNALAPELARVASPDTVTEDLTPSKPAKPEKTVTPKVALKMPVTAKPRATTTGLLFQPAAGSTVAAAAAGKVLYAGPFRQFGGLIIVEVAPRVQHIFAGLGTLNVKAGQSVTAGQQIGKLPSSGAVHLYWEVRKNGQPQSAARILAGN